MPNNYEIAISVPKDEWCFEMVNDLKSVSLRRYTDLAQALFMLHERKMTLMDPNNWDDKNDSMFLSEYKVKKKLKVVAALCFARASETYHHWGIFSKGNDGVCICFNMDKLVSQLSSIEGMQCRSVEYKTFDQMRETSIKVDDLPFLKRYGYSAEKEFRVLYESGNDGSSYPAFPIDLSCITRIVVSPWLPEPYFKEVKRVLKRTGLPSSVPVLQSTLIGSRKWQEFAHSAT
jgi:hypothetical protein